MEAKERFIVDMITGRSFRLTTYGSLIASLNSQEINSLIIIFGSGSYTTFDFDRFTVEVTITTGMPRLSIIPSANETVSTWLNWFMAAYGARITRV